MDIREHRRVVDVATGLSKAFRRTRCAAPGSALPVVPAEAAEVRDA